MFNMGFFVNWSWLVALSCLLCMGGEVWCDCPETNLQIEGGIYKLSRELTEGSMLVYSCPEGFYPYPALTRICQPDGRWRPEPKRFLPQRCRVVECPDPNVLEYGNVFPPQQKYFVNHETTYECNSGHTMRGSSRRVCLPNGKWSGSTPICSHDFPAAGENCADPGIPAGASRTGNMFGIDDRVTYSCNGNLLLVGSKERVCQENGQWTGKEPGCYFKHTYDTPSEVSDTFGSTIKHRLSTLEPTDDTQEGRKIAITKNGTLNIYIAVDISESIDENYVRQAKKAVTTLISKISSFSVTPNYEILFFSCDIFEVVNILDSWDDKRNLSTIMTDVDNFKAIEDRGTRGGDLNLVFHTFLERMAFVKLRVGEEAFKEHHHVLIVFTDGGYNTGGSPAGSVKRIKNMVYMSNSEGDTHPREEHLDIYIFAVGDEIFDDELQPLTTGTGGKHYFRLKDIHNLHEAFDEMIDEGEVIGLCGLHKEYETVDRYGKRNMYPWMAFIVIQNEGRSRKCIGSLVSPRFVLTAASCFTFGDIPEYVSVEIDDGEGKVKKVETFMIHPRYNINGRANLTKEFYDYDVALIQLEEDVKISGFVRPICIPCTRETNDALKLPATATCKDQEQLLLKDHLERLHFLTRTRNIVDEKTVEAKLGTNRDECIRHALNAPGVTAQNPADVVTDNFLCTGGRQPRRDHKACKGDSGGAVFKNYEHRTVQVAVVSWGTKTLCEGGGLVESDNESRDFHLNLFKVVPFLKHVLGNVAQHDYAPLQFLEN